jgi:hypothetical protein
MMLFENSAGGRIGIIPLNGSSGALLNTNFRSWKRQRALFWMLEWLNGGPLPLFVGNVANVWPYLRMGKKTALVGIANLSGDPLPGVTFRLAHSPVKSVSIECLKAEGKVKTDDTIWDYHDGALFVSVTSAVESLDMVCVRILAT